VDIKDPSSFNLSEKHQIRSKSFDSAERTAAVKQIGGGDKALYRNNTLRSLTLPHTVHAVTHDNIKYTKKTYA